MSTKYYTVIVTNENGEVIGNMEIDADNVCWCGDEFASVIQAAADGASDGIC